MHVVCAGLKTVPQGDWFCPAHAGRRHKGSAAEKGSAQAPPKKRHRGSAQPPTPPPEADASPPLPMPVPARKARSGVDLEIVSHVRVLGCIILGLRSAQRYEAELCLTCAVTTVLQSVYHKHDLLAAMVKIPASLHEVLTFTGTLGTSGLTAHAA